MAAPAVIAGGLFAGASSLSTMAEDDGGDCAPVLRLLREDPAASVRAAVVEVLGTAAIGPSGSVVDAQRLRTIREGLSAALIAERDAGVRDALERWTRRLAVLARSDAGGKR